MSLTESAATIKNKRRRSQKQSRPDPNSQLGKMYDALLTGEWIDPQEYTGKRHIPPSLVDGYGMRITSRRKSAENCGKTLRCVGFLVGAEFVTIEEVARRLAIEEQHRWKA